RTPPPEPAWPGLDSSDVRVQSARTLGGPRNCEGAFAMSTAAPLQNAAARSLPTAGANPLLQRKCACGAGSSGLTGKWEQGGKRKIAGLQTKLWVNEPGDIYEQEADRVAEHVLTKPAHLDVHSAPPRIQRLSGQLPGPTVAVPLSVNRALASPGKPLEPALRRDMELRFGYDF